jgi:hypothetical protein
MLRARSFWLAVAAASLVPVLPAQPAKVFQAQSSSTINASKAADGSQLIEVRNVTYELATNVPGRPPDEFLVLRKTTHSKETVGDIGVDASVMLEAWRFGDDLRQKPIYTISATGTDGHTMDNAIFIVSRGLEEVEWWSVYTLGNGQHLFDTYLPLVSFSISKEFLTTRYVGLEVPPDDTRDARLKQPNVVGVLTYASEDRVIREALLTCDNAGRAVQFRSFADETRELSMVETAAAANPQGKPREPSRTVKLSFSESYPSPPNTTEVLIPLQGDDLDLTHAKLPPGMHASGWQR